MSEDIKRSGISVLKVKEESTSKKKSQFIEIIKQLPKLSDNQYKYLCDFIAKSPSISNISRLVGIMNDNIENKEFINMCVEHAKTFIKPGYEFNNSIISDCKKDDEKYSFTPDQCKAINKVINFITDKTQAVFGLYGYAGTGKTSTIVELMYYLLVNRYIKSVVFVAPTNKAVNIMKSKMDPFIKKMVEKIFTIKQYTNAEIELIFEKDDGTLEYLLELLKNENIKIKFMTTHKLLNFVTDYDNEGNVIFKKDKKHKPSVISKNEIVIIDECSMIEFDKVLDIFKDIKTELKKSFNAPKIIFSGDPAQLPPINERHSIIFLHNDKQFDYNMFRELKGKTKITEEELKKEYKSLTKEMNLMKTHTLKQVVRSNIPGVTTFCNNVREWVIGKRSTPDICKSIGVNVYETPQGSKFNKPWFDAFRDNILSEKSSIILTWTNKSTNFYNDKLRSIIYKDKKTLNKFEINDILIMNNYYICDVETYDQDDNEDMYAEMKKENKLYTSEQVRVQDIQIIQYKDVSFPLLKAEMLIGFKCAIKLCQQYNAFVIRLNTSLFELNYKVWKLEVVKCHAKPSTNKYYAYVIDDKEIKKLDADKKIVNKKIQDLKDELLKLYADEYDKFEPIVIKPLWKQWNKIFVDKFAEISYGYSITCHKSQGSTFENVFIDIDDICINKNENDMKKCIYTSVSRASNEIYLKI